MNTLNQNLLSEHLAKGNEFCAAGEYQEAIESFNEALEIDPNNVNALEQIRFALEKLGAYQLAADMHGAIIEALGYEWEMAIKLGKFFEMPRIFSGKKRTLNNTGILLFKSGKYQEAIVVFNMALEGDPEHVDALIGKGITLIRLEKYQEAIEIFNKVPEEDLKYADALSGRRIALNRLRKA